MEKVLARRDDNWKKLQQYVLEEKEAFDLTGPGRFPLWGMRREYTWFIRDGIFVRSPVSADGVKLSEADRRKAEEQWLRRQKNREEREKRNAERRAKGLPEERGTTSVVDRADRRRRQQLGRQGHRATPITNTEDMLKQVREPQFVSSAYFLKFRFEKGHYALAGREKIGDIQALKIEYYPEAGLFKDDRQQARQEGQGRRRQDPREDEQGVDGDAVGRSEDLPDPAIHLRRHRLGLLPRPRAGAHRRSSRRPCRWDRPFPNIWLPKSIEMHFEMMLAVGAVDATYRVDYENYKEAAVTYKIK